VQSPVVCNGGPLSCALQLVPAFTSIYASQRFRFCGDLDAPDWILAEVSILSKMVRVARNRRPPPPVADESRAQSSVRMTLLCRQVMQQLLGNGINVRECTRIHRGR
jgi:hypothetical protein